MSLLSRNELRVVFGPDQLALLRARRRPTLHGMRREVEAREVVDCVAGADAPHAWSGALVALEAALPRLAAPGMEAHVVLSNHFVQYIVVPWVDSLSDEEELEFARHCFREIYGSAADAWSVRINPGRHGAPTLASAVDDGLLAELRGTFANAGLQVKSIQPHLMAACNGCQGGLQGRNAWVALLERNCLCLAMVRQGQLTWIRQVRVGQAWHEELAATLEREAYLADTEVETDEVLLWAPHLAGSEAVAAVGRWRIERLNLSYLPGDAGVQEA